jgi:hypothetical protein
LSQSAILLFSALLDGLRSVSKSSPFFCWQNPFLHYFKCHICKFQIAMAYHIGQPPNFISTSRIPKPQIPPQFAYPSAPSSPQPNPPLLNFHFPASMPLTLPLVFQSQITHLLAICRRRLTSIRLFLHPPPPLPHPISVPTFAVAELNRSPNGFGALLLHFFHCPSISVVSQPTQSPNSSKFDFPLSLASC